MGIPAAIAVGAHPDDIEFYMAGTLLLLKRAGYQIHYFNIAGGNCGSSDMNSDQTRRRRAKEARSAAGVLGAHFHPSLTNDLEIIYDVKLLRRVTAVIRDVNPALVLTHSPWDYMEDHTNTCRLAVSAAFARGMPNFLSSPPRRSCQTGTTIYHCMPHGLKDPLRRRVSPGSFVNTTPVQKLKLQALAQHQSQQKWLAESQGLNSYLKSMEQMSLQVGRMSGKFIHAEGWRRHLHLGFSASEADPLACAIGKNYLVDRTYEKALDRRSSELCYGA